MTNSRAKSIPWYIAAIILVIGCLLQAFCKTSKSNFFPLGFFNRVEGWTYDARVKLATKFPAETSPHLAAVFIDDVALEDVANGKYGWRHLWPWPRFLHGRIVRELKAQGASEIGFDILFPQEYPRSAETDQEVDGRVLSSDEFFAREMRLAGNVVLASEQGAAPVPLFRTNAAALGDVYSATDFGVLRKSKAFDYEFLWHPDIEHLARVFEGELDLTSPRFESNRIVFPVLRGEQPGEHSIALNPDGSLDLEELGLEKTSTPQMPYERKRVWNFGLQLAARKLGLNLETAQVKEGSIEVIAPNGISRRIPVDEENNFFIDWTLTFKDIKQGKVPVYPGWVHELLIQDAGRQSGQTNVSNPYRDKVVIIGSVATGNNITDRGATPLEDETMLVTKHINIANSLLINRFIRISPLFLDLLILAAFVAISSWLAWRAPVVKSGLCILLFAGCYFAAAVAIYVSSRYVLPLVSPIVAGLIAPHFFITTYRVVFEQREQRHIKAVFNKIVSPQVVDELLNQPSLSLGGARRRITVYFADVRGFTEYTDAHQATAEENVKRLGLTGEQANKFIDQQAAESLNTVNLYLATIADLIKKHHGTLDKYIGDCVMAFWGAPVYDEHHALNCVRAAIEAQRALYALNVERQVENKRREDENKIRMEKGDLLLPMLPLLAVGTGINTGMVTVGLMGSDDHILNYTVFGREVNVASRLESFSHRGRIIITEGTYMDIQRDDPELASTCVPLPAVNVRGIRSAIKVYEVPWREMPPGMREGFTTTWFTKKES